MDKYWIKRMAKAQQNATSIGIKEINKQVAKYYNTASKRLIADFKLVLATVLSQADEGKQITPALLYQLDDYWKLQTQVKQELEKLGNKERALYIKRFEQQFFKIYELTSMPGEKSFTTLQKENVVQMINQVWCADGKAWSQRIWDNVDKLALTLNEELIHCAVAGKTTKELTDLLQERFNVSFNQADTLVRTEMAHIQTQASQQRYKDYGIKEVKVLVDPDERTCPICAKYEGKRYPVNAVMPVPFHPKCRCCMVPVVE